MGRAPPPSWPRYFKSAWNLFDFALVLLTAVDVWIINLIVLLNPVDQSEMDASEIEASARVSWFQGSQESRDDRRRLGSDAEYAFPRVFVGNLKECRSELPTIPYK